MGDEEIRPVMRDAHLFQAEGSEHEFLPQRRSDVPVEKISAAQRKVWRCAFAMGYTAPTPLTLSEMKDTISILLSTGSALEDVAKAFHLLEDDVKLYVELARNRDSG